MRYSSQIDNVKSIEWGLNIQEAYVFSFLYSTPSWADEVILSGNVYFFVSRNLACKEIPLFTEKPDTMYRCYKALEKKGLVSFIKIEGKDCVSITKKGKQWNTKVVQESEYSENNPTYKSTNTNKSKIDKSNESPLPDFIQQNRGKLKRAVDEEVDFTNETKPTEVFLKYVGTDLMEILNKYPSFTSLHKEDKKKHLIEFSQNAVTKCWSSKFNLADHIIKSLKYYKPTKEVYKKRA